jgi:hypothetical protein
VICVQMPEKKNVPVPVGCGFDCACTDLCGGSPYRDPELPIKNVPDFLYLKQPITEVGRRLQDGKTAETDSGVSKHRFA